MKEGIKKDRKAVINEQNQIHKSKDGLIKCITSWWVWPVIIFSFREDWLLLVTWNASGGKLASFQRWPEMVTCWLYSFWQLVYFWFTLIPQVLPSEVHNFYQRPFSLDLWFFSPQPYESYEISKNFAWFIIFFLFPHHCHFWSQLLLKGK